MLGDRCAHRSGVGLLLSLEIRWILPQAWHVGAARKAGVASIAATGLSPAGCDPCLTNGVVTHSVPHGWNLLVPRRQAHARVSGWRKGGVEQAARNPSDCCLLDVVQKSCHDLLHAPAHASRDAHAYEKAGPSMPNLGKCQVG